MSGGVSDMIVFRCSQRSWPPVTTGSLVSGNKKGERDDAWAVPLGTQALSFYYPILRFRPLILGLCS